MLIFSQTKIINLFLRIYTLFQTGSSQDFPGFVVCTKLYTQTKVQDSGLTSEK